jgi:S1-C subfamily serine protease
LAGTGTGFVVNKDYVVTAEHVLEDCTAISIRHSQKEINAKTVARDAANDLGLIRLSQPIWNTAKLRGGRPVRKGERVSNYGYPLFGQLADSATITQGNINNLSGLGNDSRFFQFDAPSQPGNSGGPVLDSSGNVVGVVSHILSKKYADKSGHIAQNVNFAVKSYLVESFLSSNIVSFEKAESTEKLELPDIAEKAERFTVLVGCWE